MVADLSGNIFGCLHDVDQSQSSNMKLFMLGSPDSTDQTTSSILDLTGFSVCADV